MAPTTPPWLVMRVWTFALLMILARSEASASFSKACISA